MTGSRALVVEVRLPGGRFHGVRRTDRARSADNTVETPEWPPSPFRLFQAMVAGAYGGRWATEQADAKDAAFTWLEAQGAPIVGAPAAQALAHVTYFVPNNDLDAMGGDPARVSEIRVAKRLRTTVLADDAPILYAWTFAGPTGHAELLTNLAERLHTLGQGIDQAFASAVLIDAAHLHNALHGQGRQVIRPGGASSRVDGTPCPAPGSLASLKARHHALRQRFRQVTEGKRSVIEFRQPPRAQARMVVYGAGPARLLFELRNADRSSKFQPTLQTGAAALVKAVRKIVFDRLADAMPERRDALERAIIGRGDPAPDPETRLRFIPLPSIGLVHTSPSIRRLLVEIPSESAITVDELRWALTGRVFGGQADADGVFTGQTLLAPTDDHAMAERYMSESTRWQSVTPVVLPGQHVTRVRDGDERRECLEASSRAVAQALRHAGVEACAVSIRLQREPFRQRGCHVEDHDADRFGTARLQHLEVRLDRAVKGPMVLGDGRWLGLGLMAPVSEQPTEVHVFSISGAVILSAQALDLTRALRRAVMSRVQAWLGEKRELPSFFSGHEPDGRPAGDPGHQHLFYLADGEAGNGRIDRVAIIAPPLRPDATSADKRNWRRNLETLASALRSLTTLYAGRNGVLRLRPTQPQDGDLLFAAGPTWVSRTPYRPTRQPKRNVEAELERDVRLECARRGLPAPKSVEILAVAAGVRGRVSARLRLSFAGSLSGPLLLGEGAHFGLSLFELDRSSQT